MADVNVSLTNVKIAAGKFSATAAANVDGVALKATENEVVPVIKGKHGILSPIQDSSTYEYVALTGGDFKFTDGADGFASIAAFDASAVKSSVKITVNAGDGGNKKLTEVITGSGKDFVSVKALAGDSTFDLGAGNDSIAIEATTTAAITLGDGKDTINVTDAADGAITITDYNAKDDTLILSSADAATTVKALYDDSAFEIIGRTGTTITASTDASDGVYELKLSNGGANATHFVRSNMASVDYKATEAIDFENAAEDINVVNLTLAKETTSKVNVSATSGDFNLDASGKKANASVKVGDAEVALGLGISKKSGRLDVSVGATAIQLDENDTLYLNDGGKLDEVEYVAGTGDLKYGDATVVKAFATNAEGSFNYNIGGDTGVLGYGNATTSVVAYTQGVDYYLGTVADTSVDAGDYDGDVVIALDGSGDAKYSENINSIMNVKSGLVAGRKKEANTIGIVTEADKKTEVYGGGEGKDTINLAADTDSTNVIWYSNGDGKDTVTGFENGKNSIYFHNATAVASILNDVVDVNAAAGGTMTVTLAKSKDVLTVNGVSEKVVEFKDAASNIFKVAVGDGKDVTYNTEAKIYKNATTLKVDGSDDLIIYTGAKNDQYGYFDDIMTIDAAEATGTVALSGSDTNGMKIIGGTGVNNMWGGGKNVQVLEGNEDAAVNVFWFGTGDGKDMANNAKATDGVNLWNVEKLDDVAVKVSNTSFTVTIGSDVLKVNTADDATEVLKDFTFADKSGVLYTYNTETSKFQKK